MRRTTIAVVALAAALLAAKTADAQGTVKIGVVMSYSGQFADPGSQIDNGIKLYMKEHGDMVAGKKIVLIRKDNGGIAPDVAKRLSQEASTDRTSLALSRETEEIFGQLRGYFIGISTDL